uniref:Uncharacterized protein n=1 Tax=Anguilla anguilla TaxID=7936 RepID=A0A0E9PY13_ANGAN
MSCWTSHTVLLAMNLQGLRSTSKTALSAPSLSSQNDRHKMQLKYRLQIRLFRKIRNKKVCSQNDHWETKQNAVA